MSYSTVTARHKTEALALIAAMGEDIEIRQPVARSTSTNDMEKVLGATTDPDAYGTTTTVTGMVHQGKVPSGAMGFNTSVSIVGLIQNSDLVVSVALEDVLVDATKKYGRTLFDTAKTVIVGGSTFEVGGTFRSGMPPLGPYILWVGLEIQGE